MVFNNVSQLTKFPEETLNISVSSTGTVITNSWVRYSNLFRRYGEPTPGLYDIDIPGEYYGTSYDANTFTIPPTSAIRWDSTPDNFLTIYFRNTGDPYINIIPSRFIPTLTAIGDNELSGTSRFCNWYYSTSYSNIDDTEDRISELYLNTASADNNPTIDILYDSTYYKTRIIDSNYYRFTTARNTAAGILGKPIIGVAFRATATVDSSAVEFNIFPSPGDNTILYSKPRYGTTDVCGTTAISGTFDYTNGAWNLSFNCGPSVANSYLYVSYLEKDINISPTMYSNTVGNTFHLSSDQPLYLAQTDFTVSSGGDPYEYGFSISFDAYAQISNNYTSEVAVTPKMKDVYRELEVNLNPNYSKWRLVSPIVLPDLSAVDSLGNPYTMGTWLDGNNYPLYLATTGDYFSYYNTVLEISSTTGQVLTYNVNVATNSANSDLSLVEINSDGNIFHLEIDTVLDLSPTSLIYFDLFPNNNGTTLETCDGTEITLNSGVQYQYASCLSAFGVGLGTTTILLTSGEIGVTGYYVIESNESLEDYTFKIKHELQNTCEIANVYSVSAYFINSLGEQYVPPVDGSICWNATSNSSYEVTANNRDGQSISLNTCNSSNNNDQLTLKMLLSQSSDYAIGDFVNVSAKFTALNGYSTSTNTAAIQVQSKPDPQTYGAFFNVLSSGTSTVSAKSTNTTNFPLITGAYNLDFVMDLPNILYSYDLSNVTWNINGTLSSGVSSITQNISSLSADTICATLCVADVSLGRWASKFCFTDSICFKFVPGNTVDFIAFPKNRYSGASLTQQDFSNYTGTYGNTAYDCGHSELFYLSAEGGYDSYNWKIGSSQKTTESNTTTLQVRVNPDEIGVNQIIYLSAFDEEVSTNEPFYGFSDNSNKYKQHVVFYGYFDRGNSSTISTNIFNLNENSSQPFTINLEFNSLTASPVKVVNGTATIQLSSQQEIKTLNIPISKANSSVFNYFTLSEDDFFRIRPNTFNEFNLCVSANLGLRINDYNDFQIKTFETSSVCIPITAYNGPFLSITSESPCVSSGVTTVFQNVTPSFLGIYYTDFTFDDGNGNIMTATTTSTPLTGFYSESGTYSPVLCGTLDGVTVVKNFPNFVIADCGAGCENYDSSYNRTFPEELKFPNTLNDIRLKPNERLTHLSINDSFEKIEENFNYLKNKSKAYSLDVPTAVPDVWYSENIGKDSTSWKKRNNLYFFISDKKIKIVDATNVNNQTILPEDRLVVLKHDNIITDGETFVNPIEIEVNSDGTRYIVLDGGTKSIYVFDFDVSSLMTTLKTYWGGPGSRSARTKFNSPNDITLSQNNNLYVSDSDSYIVKMYNNHFNWIRNIEHSDFLSLKLKLISINVDSDDNLYVLGENEYVYVFDSSGNFTNKFKIDNLGQIYVNQAYDGIVYIVSGAKVYKYTKDGLKINQWLSPNFDSNIVGFEQSGNIIRVMTKDYIYVVFDCLELVKLRDEELDDNFWPLSSININKNEFVQDWNYNDSFKKIFQNIEMFKRSIKYKFITYKDPIDETRTIYSLVDFQDSDNVECEVKDYIGINEFVSFEVFNRVIDSIYTCMLALLRMIESRPRLQTDCNDWCYTWKKLETVSDFQPSTCDNNPISWVELSKYGITSWNGLSCSSCSATELELLNFQLSAASNRVPHSIDKC